MSTRQSTIPLLFFMFACVNLILIVKRNHSADRCMYTEQYFIIEKEKKTDIGIPVDWHLMFEQ
jgi:hypothetical protein